MNAGPSFYKNGKLKLQLETKTNKKDPTTPK